jgi:hypothetical protein
MPNYLKLFSAVQLVAEQYQYKYQWVQLPVQQYSQFPVQRRPAQPAGPCPVQSHRSVQRSHQSRPKVQLRIGPVQFDALCEYSQQHAVHPCALHCEVQSCVPGTIKSSPVCQVPESQTLYPGANMSSLVCKVSVSPAWCARWGTSTVVVL